MLLGVQCELLVNFALEKFSFLMPFNGRLAALTIFATPIVVLDVPTGWK